MAPEPRKHPRQRLFFTCTATVQKPYKSVTVKMHGAILESTFNVFINTPLKKLFVVYEGARELHSTFASSKIEPESFAGPVLRIGMPPRIEKPSMCIDELQGESMS